jgi:hypothetical protein
MALIAAVTARDKTSEFTIVPTVLGASATLTYKAAVNQLLVIRNAGVASATVVIDGDEATTVSLPGQGKPISNAAGYSVIVAAGAVVAIPLSSIRNFLAGVVTLTGGTADTTAWILEG